METSLLSWFGSVEVVRDGDSVFSTDSKYVFGYHPHGLFPIGACINHCLALANAFLLSVGLWCAAHGRLYETATDASAAVGAGIGYLPLLPTFRQLLPGIHPVALVASVVFFVPLIRDFCSWAGFRQVSTPVIAFRAFTYHCASKALMVRLQWWSLSHLLSQVTKKSFIRALRERGSVMCCPGGQAELVHTHRSFRPMREWVIITHHKGDPLVLLHPNVHVTRILNTLTLFR